MTSLLKTLLEAKMTYDENVIKALYDYEFGYTTDINYRFHTSSATSTDIKEASKISSVMKSQKLPVLYRATSWEYMQKWFGVYRDCLDVWIGKIFVDKGFVSTSLDPRVPMDFYPNNSETVYFTIKSKKAVKAVNINDVLGKASPSPSDKEVLLDRNTKFKILSCDVKNNIYHIDLEII